MYQSDFFQGMFFEILTSITLHQSHQFIRIRYITSVQLSVMFDYEGVYFAPLGVELDSVPLVDEGVGRGWIVGSYDDPFGEGGGGVVA